MMASAAGTRSRFELLVSPAPVDVGPAEYDRLLGYPAGHQVAERAAELAKEARAWFAAHGRPWVYAREAELEVSEDALRIDGVDFPSGLTAPPLTVRIETALRIDGVDFPSGALRELLLGARAGRVMLVAVSAGRSCEEEARLRWEQGRPDEYFFLEVFGSAVVEQLVATVSGRICAQAESEGWVAVPHYSPGYTGWKVEDQGALHALIRRGASQPWPEPLEVLPSGMLRPKKSLLAVVGLAPRSEGVAPDRPAVACERCALANCQYRRQPHRAAVRDVAASAEAAGRCYSVNPRALAKWARERVQLSPQLDGGVAASFRFDGTTCSNQGRPLAFDYTVRLGPASGRRIILDARCAPAPADDGHRWMCAYLSDGDELLRRIAQEQPLLGRPLDDVLTWSRPSVPTGCYCDAAGRAHKWGLALEAIHYALAGTTNPFP